MRNTKLLESMLYEFMYLLCIYGIWLEYISGE